MRENGLKEVKIVTSMAMLRAAARQTESSSPLSEMVVKMSLTQQSDVSLSRYVFSKSYTSAVV